MRTVRMLKVLATVLLLSSANAAAQSDAKSVTATGQAAGTDLKAKDEACNEARRTAIRQTCGERINAYTNVVDFQVKRDRILSNPVGYITSEDIKRRWDDGQYSYCELFATVATGKFAADWNSMFEHIREDVGNPRCVVMFMEDNDMDDLVPPHTNGVAQSRIEHFFLEHGVHLMDKEVGEDVRARDIDLAKNEDARAVAQRAAAFKADVAVSGRAEARRGSAQELAGHMLYKWDITLTVRVIQADSAQILAVNTYRPKKGFSTTVSGNGDEGLEKLADEVAPQLLKDVGEAWRKRTTAHSVFELTIDGCSRSDFRKRIEPALRKLQMVQQGDEGVKLREAVGEVITAEVYWSGDLNSLADAMEDLHAEGVQLRVVEQSANRVRCRITAATP
ncbi:MAG: hypothetical protein HY287_01360 [Planctomycetes bacterium]|nr:hypothetical protein [Planctomycetota bacterium]MBI3832955.1 hypothetical protein [Planctomycetota bacterium]